MSAPAPVNPIEQLLPELKARLPAEALILDSAGKRPYETDGLTALRAQPGVVVLPDSADQVQWLLRRCSELGVPVVPRGAGTGLSGGALPREDGVLLGFSKMQQILELDPGAGTARVQPGVRNIAISEAAAPLGLYYAPDPSSQIACSIGGNVAENSGGVHCVKYGLTVHNILGLKGYTMDGEPLEVGGTTLDCPGYDLLAVLCGSEGMLAVITEITVRLLPVPISKRVLLAAFPTPTAAARAVSSVIAAGIVPAGLEMMDKLAIEAVEGYLKAGYPTHAGALLLCELDGEGATVAADLARVTALFEAEGAHDLRIAESAEEQANLWQGRKAAFPALGRIAPDYYCMDGTIPLAEIATVLSRIEALSNEYGLAVANVFHAGDGNLHPLILYDANKPGELATAEALGHAILCACVDAGGTVTGEHGVGVEKLDGMCHQFPSSELEQFHRLKAAFDPQTLLNPGKGIPTLTRCSELGGMHVHGGKVPFAGLPRF
ncbi:MAG: FAD-linked oxidase C-terminal domain-containing protein [Pseudomonadota bacterium]